MTKSDWIQIALTLVSVVGSVLAAYLKLKDQIAETKEQSKVNTALLATALDDIKVLNSDVHNIALLIGTKRALAEESAKNDTSGNAT